MEKDRYYFWALSLVFITLKLTGTIDWSWWLIMSPIWGPFLVHTALTLALCAIVKRRERRRAQAEEAANEARRSNETRR